jgi:hypothetical protein
MSNGDNEDKSNEATKNMNNHTPGDWTTIKSDNDVYALMDGEGKHFANFRNIRGDIMEIVEADLKIITSAIGLRGLYETTRNERDALADAVEAVRHLEPALVMPAYVNDLDSEEAFFEGSIHAAQAFREAIIEAIRSALDKLPGK